MTHKEKAEQLLKQQYHCSQALFGAFAEDFGLDLKTAFKISTCFGGGMRQGGTCGCITASLLILGMTIGFYDSQDREQEVYGNKKTEEFIRLFSERMNGAVNCRDILGKDISKPNEMAEIRKQGLILHKCPGAINISIEILEEKTLLGAPFSLVGSLLPWSNWWGTCQLLSVLLSEPIPIPLSKFPDALTIQINFSRGRALDSA